MSFKLDVLKRLHGSELPWNAQIVLRTIADYADGDGSNAFPGHARLAEDCRMSVRTIRRHIRTLLTAGWLVEESRGRLTADGPRYSAYRLNAPEMVTEPAADVVVHDVPDSAPVIDLDATMDVLCEFHGCENPGTEMVNGRAYCVACAVLSSQRPQKCESFSCDKPARQTADGHLLCWLHDHERQKVSVGIMEGENSDCPF